MCQALTAEPCDSVKCWHVIDDRGGGRERGEGGAQENPADCAFALGFLQSPGVSGAADLEGER